MTRVQVAEIAAKHGVKIDGQHKGASRFVDLEIGVGADVSVLSALQGELVDSGIVCKTTLRRVNNPDHEQYGKPYIEVASFWNE